MSNTNTISNIKKSHRGVGHKVLYIILWVALFAALLHFDVSLMQWRYRLFADGPDGLLRHLLNNCREFGQLVCVIVVLIIVVTYDRRWKSMVVAILLAQGLAALVYNPSKVLIARYRPQSAIDELASSGGDDKELALSAFTSRATWLGWRPGNVAAETQSFPSGHSAGAFALAVVLVRFYPRLAWMFWTLATGCAASRYLDAVHWPSDCMAGATIGYVAALLAMGLVITCAGPESGRTTTHHPQ